MEIGGTETHSTVLLWVFCYTRLASATAYSVVVCTDFLQERIDKTKAMIVALEDAILGLTDGTILSYMLDTGQTEQRVTRQNIVEVQRVVDRLYNRLTTLQNRCSGGGTFTSVPGW